MYKSRVRPKPGLGNGDAARAGPLLPITTQGERCILITHTMHGTMR
jgi:hypothetical protein